MSTQTLLRLATCCIFLGWGGQHWLGETKYSSLLWDEDWLGGWVGDWSYYSHEMVSASFIRLLSDVLGGFLLFCGLWGLRPQLPHSPTRILWGMGSFLLLLQACFAWKEHFFELAQFAEYSIQWLSPLLFLTYTKWGGTRAWWNVLRGTVALTFAGHGIYAIGCMPMPVHFMEMTMALLNCTEPQAFFFLKMAGLLDFLACILLFLPFSRYRKIGLAYMVAWGFLTALARLAYALEMEFSWGIFWHTWPQTVYRLAHGLVPWALWQRAWLSGNPVKEIP